MKDFDEIEDFGDDEEEVDTRSEYDDFESGKDDKKLNNIIIGIIVVFIIILIIAGIYASVNKKKNTTEEPVNTITMQESIVFELNGDQTMTLFVGEQYNEPGYYAESNTNGSLNSFVEVNGGVDTSAVGVYEITYTLIYDGTTRELVRTIEVVVDGEEEKPKDETPVDNGNSVVNISLNGASSFYVFKGVAFQDPGATAQNKNGVDISSSIIKSGNVDTNNVGTYTLTYSITSSNNETKSVSRKVHVLDMSATITPNTNNYTNEALELTIKVQADRFSHIILPDGQKVSQSTYTYKVNSNEKYSFTVYNEVGLVKKYTYTVKTIDKEVPTGSCTVTHGTSGSVVTINASDNIGVHRYSYNNKIYSTNTLTFGGYFASGLTVSVGFYDKAGNYGTATCVVPAR